MVSRCAAALLVVVLAISSVDAAEGKVEVRDGDVVILYGDSITQQNLYSAYIETYLITRLIDREFRVYNFGWGGDTANGGNHRFERDVMPVKPTLVFVNYGMNDGRYTTPNAAIYDSYMKSQAALADTIAAAGARQVMLSTSPVYPVDWNYNETLAKFADGVLGLAKERGMVSADICHPMFEDLTKLHRDKPGHSLIPDRVHPGAAGHLLMAYYALRAVDAPGLVGDIAISGGRVSRSDGVQIENVRSEKGVVSFDLTLEHIPFYVPPDARESLAYVPFQREMNRFVLAIEDWAPDRSCLVSVDGEEAGVVSGESIRAGADLALLDGATWAKQGREVYQRAQFRWRRHFEAWRPMDVEAPAFATEPEGYGLMIMTARAYVDELGDTLREVAKPRTYSVQFSASTQIDLKRVSLSPPYPYRKEQFGEAFPPETAPDGVEWKSAELDDAGGIDFTKVFENPTNCIVYARVVLDAEAACDVGLSLGSDDGIKVVVNGEVAYGNDTYRGYSPGEDKATIELREGRNIVLFGVTQGNGGHGFGVQARVVGETRVTVVEPE